MKSLLRRFEFSHGLSIEDSFSYVNANESKLPRTAIHDSRPAPFCISLCAWVYFHLFDPISYSAI